MIDRQARVSARGRHPSAGWRPDLARFTRHMTEVFAREGRSNPLVAAAVTSARGATGETLGECSARTGIAPAWLARLESGEVEAALVPTVVTEAAPWIEWASLSLGGPD